MYRCELPLVVLTTSSIVVLILVGFLTLDLSTHRLLNSSNSRFLDFFVGPTMWTFFS